MSIARMVGSKAAQTLTGILTGGTVGTAGLILTGTLLAFIEWKEHKEAKKLEAITAAVAQARCYFGNIIVPGYESTKILKLPDFWDMTDPAKPKSMFLPIENIRQMVNATGSGKPVLDPYVNAIRSALKEYFLFYEVCFMRWVGKSSDDDVTPVVLCNLIYLLSEHCSKFEGYALDIRIIDVVSRYNEAFAKGHEERERYLTPVNRSLVLASNALLKHSKKLSLEETIEDAWPPCKQVTEGLMSDITQLLTLTDLRKFTEFAKPELLAKGIVKAKFFKWRHYGTHPQEIALVDSKFTREFMLAVRDYMDITKSDVSTPSKPPLQLSRQAQAKLEKKEKEEKEETLNFFNSVNNFLTRVSSQGAVDDPEKPTSLVPITKLAVLNKNSDTINKLITLFRKMCSILKILYRTYEYANYVAPQLAPTDPNDNDDSLYVVSVLDGFNQTVKERSETLETDFINIITAFQGAMLDPEERKLYDSIMDHILTIKFEVFKRIDTILKNKLEQKPDVVKREIQQQKHALFSFVHGLAVAENIKTPDFKIIQPDMAANSSVSDSSMAEEKHPLLQTVDAAMQTDIASSDTDHHASADKGFFSRLFSSPKPLLVEVGTDPAEIEMPEPEEEKHDSAFIHATAHTKIPQPGIDSAIQTEIASSDIEHHTTENQRFFSKLFHPKPLVTAKVDTQTSESKAPGPEARRQDALFDDATDPHAAAIPLSATASRPVNLDSPILHAVDITHVSHTTPLLEKSNRDDAKPESVPTFESLDAMLASIKTHIENKSDRVDLKWFNEIYNAIAELRYHASKLQNERLTCRHERASLLKSLVYATAQLMDEFFERPHTDWVSDTVMGLAQSIRDVIADPKYRSLSRMQPVGIGRFFHNTPTTMCKINVVQSTLTSLVEHFTPQQSMNNQHLGRQ